MDHTKAVCLLEGYLGHGLDLGNRSKDCDMEEFELMIFKMIDENDMFRKVIICGDLNIHYTEETSNRFVKKIVDKYKFEQLVKDSTHVGGNTIDHVYLSPGLQGRVKVEKTCVYFSDHDLLTIRVLEENEVDEMSVSD